MKKNLLSFFSLAVFLAGCIKDYRSVDAPTFDVSSENLEYPVNTPITFKVSGYADKVTFYPGDKGRNYEFKNRNRLEGAKTRLQFASMRQYGANPGVADETMKLKISKNFNGKPNAVDIQAAEWIDITDRATWSTGANSNQVPSGIVDISDLTSGDSAIYLGFHYHELQTAQLKRAWYLYRVAVDNLMPDGSIVPIANFSQLTFTPVNIQNPLRAWYIYADYSLMWGGSETYPETEDWIISKPLFVNRTKGDLGISIRNSPKSLLTDYTFPGYKEPGVYKLVFEAYNATQWDTKQVLKEITLTIK